MKTVSFEDKLNSFINSLSFKGTPKTTPSTKPSTKPSSSSPSSSSRHSINVKHLIVNALIITVITFCITSIFTAPKLTKDYILVSIIALLSGLIYTAIEIIFVKYISDGMQSGGDNAYAYYSSSNDISPYKKNKKGGSFPYRYFDGQYAPSPSF
jgi:hypothetical protein